MVMELTKDIIKLAKKFALEQGYKVVRYKGVYMGCFIFSVAVRGGYLGKIGYPHYIAVKGNAARKLDHDECVVVTFAQPLPLR